MSFSAWREVKLGDVVDSISQKHKFDKDKIVLINTSDVLEGKVLNHEYVDNKNLKGQFKKSFQMNDILYSEIRPHNKRFAYIDFNSEDYVASTKLMVLRKRNCEILSDYLFQILKSDEVIAELQAMAESRSGTFPQITFSELSRISINLPPLPEQKAIAVTLSCLDDKIELNNRMNKNLEEMAQAIFKSWFVDFEPFQDGEFEESELGMIPKGWRVVELSEISTVQNGFAFKSSDYQESGCNMIRTTNIDMDGFVNNTDLIKLPYDFLTDKKYGNFKFQEFDTVLVMVGASVGKIGMITAKNIPALQNQNMWRFRPTLNSVSPIYIHYLVKITNDKVRNWSSGSARDFYRKDSFQNSKCLLPTEEVMNGFERIANPIFKLISKNLIENENLVSSRDTLLPKLMSGEIRVPIEEVQ